MTLASRSDRLLGQMIDGVIALSPFLGLVLLSGLAPDGLEALIGMFTIPALLFCLGYLFFADALPGGQSFGKRMLEIAVVDRQSGQPCSAWQSFVRNLLLSIFGFFDWIFIFGEQHQRLGDKAAGTIVVDAVPAPVGARAYHQ